MGPLIAAVVSLVLAAASAAPEPLKAGGEMPAEPAARPPANNIPAGSGPLGAVSRANAKARIEPRPTSYVNAAQVYLYSDGALYQVCTAPGQITDIVLQPGEDLAPTGPVAAGDTVRWIIGDSESGSGADRKVHILVKPLRAGLRTNLVINTNRRTYHLELQSATKVYMPAVAWRYPADEAKAAAAVVQVRQPAITPPAPAPEYFFGYRLTGRAPWKPLRVFDDGRRTFIEFPPSVTQGEMPPLFVIGPGKSDELVNYRVQGRRIIVERLFEAAELRLGDSRRPQRVRIVRDGGGRR